MNKYSFSILITALGLIVLYILQDFILPVSLGAICALLLVKPTVFLKTKIKSYKLSALIVVLTVSSLALVPFLFLMTSGANEILSFFQQPDLALKAQGLIGQLKTYIPNLQIWSPALSPEHINQYLTNFLQLVVGKVLTAVQNLVFQLPKLLMDLGIIMISAYFVLSEKDKLSNLVLSNKIFTNEQTSRIYQTVVMTTHSVVVASLFAGLLQAVVMGICASLIAPQKILLVSVLTFLFSFIPLIGTSPITLTLILTNWFSNNYSAVLMVLIAVGFLTLIDNVLRPMLIGNKIKIHPMLAFLAALGGLSLFGFYGLFLGPILVGIWVGLIKDLNL